MKTVAGFGEGNCVEGTCLITNVVFFAEEGDVHMVNPDVLAAGGVFVWWQIPLVILLIIVIALYVIYRRKQM